MGGIYYSQYVTIYTTVLLQYIASFPDYSLAKRLELLNLANMVVPHAMEMYDNYIAQRLSYVSGMSTSCKDQKTDCYGSWCDTSSYKWTDTYPMYDADGRTTETCTWTLYWKRDYS